MRKWVCIDNTGYEDELIRNKAYVEIEGGFADPFCILIKNEFGIVTEYHQPLRFIEIDGWREIQLKNIGI